MFTSKDWGYNNSSATNTITVPQITWSSEFATSNKKIAPGEANVNNITVPLGQPETFRFAVQNVKNVYTDTGIAPSYQKQNKSGKSLVIQETSVMSAKTYEGTAQSPGELIEEVLIPFEAHVVFKFLNDSLVTTADVRSVLCRLLAGLYNASDDQLDRLIRGAVKPVGV